MIALAKAVSYGGNSVRYALEKEKAKLVKMNHLPEGISPTAVWYIMKHHCQLHQADRTVGRKLERLMVTVVVSPSKEESANFTMDDWAALQDETLEVMDSIGLLPKGMDLEVKTNFSNSMNVGGLHSDSKSGTLHLHIDCCRVDNDGKTNDVHDIHVRAMKAAEIINMRHGWQQPQEIRDMRRQEIADVCENTLDVMNQFDIYDYFDRLRRKGYDVAEKFDKKGKLVGYTVGKNASVFKASAIGRRFMVSQLENTWKRMHPQPVLVKTKPAAPVATPTKTFTQPKVQPKPAPAFTAFDIAVDGGTKTVNIPNSIKDVFTAASVTVPEDNDKATNTDVLHIAVLLFAGYVDAATSMSASCGGGGGSSPESDWGKKDDEDDRKFAQRCIKMAHSMCKPPKRYHFRR